MLVLQRDVDQRIFLTLDAYGIKEPIVIMITRIRGDRCWVGVEAAREIGIFREELLDGTASHPR